MENKTDGVKVTRENFINPEFQKQIQEVVQKARESGVTLVDSSFYLTSEQIKSLRIDLRVDYTEKYPAKSIFITDNIWTALAVKKDDENDTMIVICVLPLSNADKNSLPNGHGDDSQE